MELIAYIGQIILGGFFVQSAIGATIDRGFLQGLLASKNIPYPQYLLFGAIGLKLVCGLALILNIFVPIAAFFAAGFLLIADVIFHPFWSMEGHKRKMEYYAFVSNVAVVGGLLVLIGQYQG